MPDPLRLMSMCKDQTEESLEFTTATSSTMPLPWPEEKDDHTSWLALSFKRWTYSYMNRVLDKGARQTLEDGTHLCPDDLYGVPSTIESEHLVERFREYYEVEKDSKRRLIRTLFRLAAPTFIPAGFCQLITVFAQAILPLLVMQLLRILEDNPGENVVDEAMFYAVLIFVTSLVNAFANNRHRHLATKSGIVMRASVVNVIYEHALNITPTGREGLTSGEVTNLLAVDTQKLFEVTQEGHLIWSCPLSMIIVTILLLIVMGPTTIVGMAVLVLFVPLVKITATKMLSIRRKRVKVSDERVEIVNAMLQGIKVTKLNNYESKYERRIVETRGREVLLLRKELFVWAMTLVMTVLSPVLATSATFTTYVLVDEDNILTASRSFTVLLLFAALRFPINFAGRLIGRAAQALEAARRISAFLDREARETSAVSDLDCPNDSKDTATSSMPLLELKNATFYVGGHGTMGEDGSNSGQTEAVDEQTCFRVSDVSFSVSAGELLAIVGSVGSGKSTLINGIIGEVPSSASSVVFKRGRVAYAGQIPFIMNETLRENILFGLPFDEERYESILDACCLRQDIQQLGPSGDLTEIGEKGVTLSGGQKQRVSLARVAYASPDIILCDDPLSALDASTAKKIFDKLFKSADNNLLRSSAVVLVTHAAHFLNQVDRVLVMVDGTAPFQGSWEDLATFHSHDTAAMRAVEFIRSSVQETSENTRDTSSGLIQGDVSGLLENTKDDETDHQGHLMTIETREHGLSSLRTWLLWFRHAGGFPFLLTQALLLGLDRFSYVATEVWLARWTKGHDQPVEALGTVFPPQTEGRSAQYEYLRVYASILAVSSLATFLRSEWAVTGGARCATKVFQAMLSSVLRAPMSYFETTPLGRILNRFTFDVEVVDVTLTESMSILMISISWFCAGVCVMCVILPWVLFALVPVTLIYCVLLLRYRKSGADLQRIDAVSRSPIQAMLAEGLDGAATIRVFERADVFLRKFHDSVNSNSSAVLNYVSAQRWLGIRIELLGSSIVLVSSVLVVSLNETLQIDPGLVALLIIWSSNWTITLAYLVDAFSESEAAITSIERVHSMANLPEEKNMMTDPSMNLPEEWPDQGRISFDNVFLRYRKGLPLALKGLSFEISPGQRVGVCGRTGSGKSTMTLALFRLVEIESGRITIDGVDLATIGLSDVRGRLSIIPQDPFLLAGTLRDCLDPFQGSNDNDILDALVAVRMARKGQHELLENRVEEGGTNFSVGERQLLCLARSLLAKPKVLVMDEATASVDGETDAFIQKMLRTRFKNTTLLTVAHRINTIMDYDSVIVMDDGKAIEYGSPAELLQQNGAFAALVRSTGDESADALREMAFKGNPDAF